jgi:hypothetical protein
VDNIPDGTLFVKNNKVAFNAESKPEGRCSTPSGLVGDDVEQAASASLKGVD